MRDFVRQFLTSASTTLDLGGPVALLAGERASGEAADWLRRQFTGELVLNCQVPTLPNARRELDLGNLPVECDSLQTLLCLDLLTRFEETAELLQVSLPLLAHGRHGFDNRRHRRRATPGRIVAHARPRSDSNDWWPISTRPFWGGRAIPTFPAVCFWWPAELRWHPALRTPQALYRSFSMEPTTGEHKTAMGRTPVAVVATMVRVSICRAGQWRSGHDQLLAASPSRGQLERRSAQLAAGQGCDQPGAGLVLSSTMHVRSGGEATMELLIEPRRGGIV